jgi:hypothetical protein
LNRYQFLAHAKKLSTGKKKIKRFANRPLGTLTRKPAVFSE